MLKSVTFAGIDDSVDFLALKKLSDKYDFIEWAVLASDIKTGNNARYLSVESYEELNKLALPLSIHLDGRIVRQIFKYNDWTSANEFINRLNCQRIQLNGKECTQIIPHLTFPKKDIILQTGISNTALMTAFAHKHKNVYLLNDNSDGTGREERYYPPYSNFDYVGYAGGISADNIERVIANISKMRISPFWIDMESGIRTTDTLDLTKCEKICEIVKSYIC